jgi:hypothetical protein
VKKYYSVEIKRARSKPEFVKRSTEMYSYSDDDLDYEETEDNEDEGEKGTVYICLQYIVN